MAIMWTIALGLIVFTLGVFLLLVLLSPKGEDRPKMFYCQRCKKNFGTPPIHPLPERYQEDDLCLCMDCSGLLEEKIRDVVRQTQNDFLTIRTG